MVTRLVALDLPGGPQFVHALQQVWDDGDVAFPVDQRLPHSARADLVNGFGATSVVAATGRSSIASGTPAATLEPGDALVLATSGTTGAAKGVILTHEAVSASAIITSAAIGVDPGNDHWLACIPVSHVGGLSVITRALHTGTPLTVHNGFKARDVIEAARSGVTLTSLVVTALARVDPDLFRLVLLGGSAIPSDRPTNTIATYGSTETGSGVVYDGRPLAGVELAIRSGEVYVRSPTLLRSYIDGTDPRTAGGWFPTNDAGELDAHGRLSVHGRLGDVIVTGGEKVWPAALEARLRGDPRVADVAVVGRPDPEWGEAVTAVVVPAAGHDAPTLEDLRAVLEPHVARYAIPKSVEHATSLPRTGGKLKRSEV